MVEGNTKKAIPIFVSSTFTDLVEHRQAVQQTLARLEALVRGMEQFGSRPGKPRDECLAEVRKCRAYIGIFGLRYGSIDSESGMSLTHLEYLEAQRLGIPTLVYLLDEERHLVLPKFVDRGESGAKVAVLRQELLSRFTVGFFSSPDDLARQVAQDLPPLLLKLGFDVQPNILLQLVESLPRIDWLSDDRWLFLREKLGELAEGGIREPVLRCVVEYLLSFDRMTAAFVLAKGSSLDMREAIDLSRNIEKVLASVVSQGDTVILEENNAPENDAT